MAGTDPPELILASTSRYRVALLQRIGVAFRSVAPDCDESALPNESPVALATRLAALKAQRVAEAHPDAVVIGSDQVAELEGVAFGKAGAHEAAVQQLRRCSGRVVGFHTAVCIVDRRRAASHAFADLTRVHFRTLRDDEIERYLRAEQPYDCAGSFKCEGLGTALFSAIETTDPSGLIGLPLIGVCERLRSCGFRIP